MLSFADLPDSPLQGQDAFPDHVESRVVYYLPPALRLAVTPAGEPDFYLLRYHGDLAAASGGLLHFGLGLQPLAEALLDGAQQAGWQVRAVGFEAARFRLRLRTWLEGEEDQFGEWHAATLAGLEVATYAVGLSARETQFVEAMIQDGRNLVEVELQLAYRGLVPGLPWLVTADGPTLRSLLESLLPDAALRAEQVVAAFWSLPAGDGTPLEWRAMEPGAVLPSHDTLLREVALRSLDRLFERQPSSDPFDTPCYRLRPASADDPPTFAWDLIPPRLERRDHHLSWSITELWQALDTPEKRDRLFSSVSQVSPFAEAKVHVINQVPYDPRYLRKVTADLRYTGLAGVPEFRTFAFDGKVTLQSFSVAYPAIVANFELACRLTAVLAPPGGSGWPVVRKGTFIPVSGQVVEISRQALGIDFVRVEAEAAVFDTATSVAVTLLPPPSEAGELPSPPLAELTLSAEQPAAWVALVDARPEDVLYARVVAHAGGEAAAPAVTLFDGPLVERRVTVAAYQLEMLDSDRITIRLDPEVEGRFALVVVSVAPPLGEGRSYTLEPGVSIVWNYFRRSIFEALRYRYRLDYVAFDSSHKTLPLVSTDWITANTTVLTVRPPLPDPELVP